MVRKCCSQKSSLVTMIALTTTFFFAEIAVGYGTNSMALVADSFHMLSDVVSLFVGFFALKVSQDKRRRNISKNTFGWVRAEVLGALVNSVFLVALCFSIMVESLKRIVSPETIDQPLLVLAIGAAGLLINIMGIFIFQGHMGHGHSHGGHGHSHGGPIETNGGHRDSHVVQCDSDGGHSMSYVGCSNSQGGGGSSNENLQIGNNNGRVLRDQFDCESGMYSVQDDVKGQRFKMKADPQGHVNNPDTSVRRAGKKDSELTTIVIVNKVVAREDEIKVEVENGDNTPSDGLTGSLAESKVHLTPSKYKMGLMLAAIQANENAGEGNPDETTSTEGTSSPSKKQKTSDQMNIRGVYLHILGDALGSVIVICSAVAIYIGSGDWTLYVDPGMSILMVAIILKSSIPLLKESSMILLQTVPTHIQIKELEEKLLGQFPSIVGVHEFHVWQLAGSKIVASLHMKLPSRGDYMNISESLKNFFHDEGIHSTTIQPEFIEEVKTADSKLSKSSLCLLKCESSQCEESFCCKAMEEDQNRSSEQTPEMPVGAQAGCSSSEAETIGTP